MGYIVVGGFILYPICRSLGKWLMRKICGPATYANRRISGVDAPDITETAHDVIPFPRPYAPPS